MRWASTMLLVRLKIGGHPFNSYCRGVVNTGEVEDGVEERAFIVAGKETSLHGNLQLSEELFMKGVVEYEKKRQEELNLDRSSRTRKPPVSAAVCNLFSLDHDHRTAKAVSINLCSA